MMTNTFRTTRRVHEKTGQSTREDRVPIMRLESRGGGFTQHNFVVSKYANMNGKPVESFIGKVSELTTGPATATGVLKFYRFCFEHLSVLFKPKSHIKNRYEFSNLVQGVWVFTMSKGTSALCVSADGETWCPARLWVFPRVSFTSTSVHCFSQCFWEKVGVSKIGVPPNHAF